MRSKFARPASARAQRKWKGAITASPQQDKLKIPRSRQWIAIFTLLAIGLSLFLRFVVASSFHLFGLMLHELPLLAALIVGGIPLVSELILKAARREFGSDLLAGISIVTAVILGEYLAGALVVLMLSGGEALEAYAARSASSVLQALAQRMPSIAHRKSGAALAEVPLEGIAVGDELIVLPHEICPVDGTVLEGHSQMDESYLTGEPYVLPKTPGSTVLSGAVNGVSALTIRADKIPADSRYAKIMQVMRDSEQRRPRLRRLGDQLGAFYTPLAVAIALAAWAASGEVVRFLAVLVVATPCPLLIAIPVSIIGSISLAARRGIIIKDPAVLEKVDICRTAIFDKTGTLTYGRPALVQIVPTAGFSGNEILTLVASLEQYSKHPLAAAILDAAREQHVGLVDAAQVSERPGEGLRGVVAGRTLEITSRKKLVARHPDALELLPAQVEGLECMVLVDDEYAGTFRFRDEPRAEGSSFVRHLAPRHHFDRVMLVSGDRDQEVRYLARQVGIDHVYSAQSPEQKLELVRRETQQANTLFVGDGINDAPAMTTATVGVAFGQNGDITAEAAGAVIMESSLAKVDELLHIGRRMRSIALESAVGGMMLSVAGMLVAGLGYLPPVAGALLQEIIDVLAVVNALRVAMPPRSLSDYAPGPVVPDPAVSCEEPCHI
jgi:heavy metal translocating P-type ATPase